MYELFEHTADIGIRARAADLNALFADAACGLFSVLVEDLASVRPLQPSPVRIAGQRYDDLLFDWLAELLFTFETRRLLFSKFDVQVDVEGVTATAWGEPMDRTRHMMDMEVKAITYHGLRVERQPGGWLAEVIVDL